MAGKTFVGFGFGPIQSGLMLLEAQASGSFGRYVIVEIMQELVDAVRANGHRSTVNVAHADGIENRVLTDIEIFNPRDAADRTAIANAIGNADELATAISSVDLYDTGGESSIAALLAAHIDPARPQILYASENNNYAAERLEACIRRHCSPGQLEHFQVLNTVIGKMSGVIQDPRVIARLELEPFAPGSKRAVLVEEFNHIFISAIRFPEVQQGIGVFEQKADLLPFEEAKLFGHNAIHALMGYVAAQKGYGIMCDIRKDAALMNLGRRAFIEESGAALLRKYADLGDPLFTETGYANYADDLLRRMTNPYLNDEVDRICRDPKRKLAYGDRLIGTMREALAQGICPRLMARGAAAALRYMVASGMDLEGLDLPANAAHIDDDVITAMLNAIWAHDKTDTYRDPIVRLVCEACNTTTP